ncbi:MAG: D-allose transporter substrate-binding protein [Treponema sp.]|nr:D-allose transporter substrate-binding protein [Treponema sp.]
MKVKFLVSALFLAMTFSVFAGGSSESRGSAEYAVILKTLASPFWQGVKEGVESKAAELGVSVDIFAAISEDDVEGQLQLMENAISRGYKAIGVAPISPVNLNSAIADATRRGIFIVNIDEMVNLENLRAQSGAVQGFVSTDNVSVGMLGAGHIISTLAGGGQVAIIEGRAGNTSGEDRRQGAARAFNAATGFTIVASQPADWDRTMAFDLTASLMTRFPNLRAIYACNDTMAMGALEAVRQAGRNIIVVGTDGNPDALESVSRGELAATVMQDTNAIGSIGFEMLVQAHRDGASIDPSAEVPFRAAQARLIVR